MMSLDNNKKTQKTTKYNNEVFQHLEEDNVITGHLYDREVSIADVRKVGVEYDEETGRSFSLRRTIVHVNDASYVLQGGFMGYASISCIEQALEDIGRGKEPKGTFKKKIDTRSPFVSLLLILFFVLPIVFILLFNVYLFTRSF